MSLTQKNLDADQRLRLTKLLRELMKPVILKRVIVTHSDRYAVRGIVLTVCPIEKREAGVDFEVVLEGNRPNSIQRVTVDGRRLFPRRTMEEHQNAASTTKVASST